MWQNREQRERFRTVSCDPSLIESEIPPDVTERAEGAVDEFWEKLRTGDHTEFLRVQLRNLFEREIMRERFPADPPTVVQGD